MRSAKLTENPKEVQVDARSRAGAMTLAGSTIVGRSGRRGRTVNIDDSPTICALVGQLVDWSGDIQEEFGLRRETEEALAALKITTGHELLRRTVLRLVEELKRYPETNPYLTMIDEIRFTLAHHGRKLLGEKLTITQLIALSTGHLQGAH